MTPVKQYLRRVGNALSQLLHAVLGGDEDITSSARSHVDDRLPWRALRRFLNWIDPGHTERAYRNDKDQF